MIPLGLALCAAAAGPSAAEPRNVLLVIVDDLGVDRVGVYGANPEPGSTPVLDALAAGGVLFRRAYAQPLCGPTRATILIGRQAFATGVGVSIAWGDGGPGGAFEPSTDEPWLPALVPRTHHVAAVGKWHMARQDGAGYTHPIDVGFDTFSGAPANLDELPTPQLAYWDWEKNVASPAGAAQSMSLAYATTDAVDDALALIDGWGDEPWFVWLAFNAAHSPFHVPPDELHGFAIDERSSDVLKHKAMAEAMDTELGRLLASIRPGVLARTNVVVIGDNGTPGQVITAPQNPGKAKGTVFEGGVHVPLIVAGPDVLQPGRQVDALVHSVDLFATLLELCGAPVPDVVRDSVSMVPYLRDVNHPSRRAWVLCEHFEPNGFGPYQVRLRGIREDRYKLVRREGQIIWPRVAFYDLWTDPGEQDNLVGTLSPEQMLAKARLDALLASFE